MRNLFKPIITTICLLLTMSAFGQESASELSEIYDNLAEEYRAEEERRKVAERDLSRIKRYHFLIRDALKGLESVDLNARDFTVRVETSEDIEYSGTDKIFLSSAQYVCRYKLQNIVKVNRQNIVKVNKQNIVKVNRV